MSNFTIKKSNGWPEIILCEKDDANFLQNRKKTFEKVFMNKYIGIVIWNITQK